MCSKSGRSTLLFRYFLFFLLSCKYIPKIWVFINVEYNWPGALLLFHTMTGNICISSLFRKNLYFSPETNRHTKQTTMLTLKLWFATGLKTVVTALSSCCDKR